METWSDTIYVQGLPKDITEQRCARRSAALPSHHVFCRRVSDPRPWARCSKRRVSSRVLEAGAAARRAGNSQRYVADREPQWATSAHGSESCTRSAPDPRCKREAWRWLAFGVGVGTPRQLLVGDPPHPCTLGLTTAGFEQVDRVLRTNWPDQGGQGQGQRQEKGVDLQGQANRTAKGRRNGEL